MPSLTELGSLETCNATARTSFKDLLVLVSVEHERELAEAVESARVAKNIEQITQNGHATDNVPSPRSKRISEWSVKFSPESMSPAVEDDIPSERADLDEPPWRPSERRCHSTHVAANSEDNERVEMKSATMLRPMHLVSNASELRGYHSTMTGTRPRWSDDNSFAPGNHVLNVSKSQPSGGQSISMSLHEKWREVVSEMRPRAQTGEEPQLDTPTFNLFANLSLSSRKPKQRSSLKAKQETGDKTPIAAALAKKIHSGSDIMGVSLSTILLFQLHPMWGDPDKFSASAALRLLRAERDARLNVMTASDLSTGNPSVLRPQGHILLIWTVIGLISLTYDFFTIPMLVFPLPENSVSAIMNWYSLIVWNLDILVKFRTGYIQEDGTTQTAPMAITRRYLKSWFVIDLCLVGLEWMVFIVNYRESQTSNDSAASTGRVVRLARICRSVRLLRLVKLGHVMNLFQDFLCTDYAIVRFSIAKTVFAMVAINHMIACMWFGIGEHFSKDGWTKGDQMRKCENFACHYTTALHWSLAQFGVGESIIYPQNEGERVFNIVVLLFALVAFSSLVSSITNAMSHLRALKTNQVMQFAMFHRFCREKQISKALTRRVQRHLEYAFALRQKQIPMSEVDLFKLLSDALRNEMQLAVWRPHICQHQLFSHLCKRGLPAMRIVARTALSDVQLAAGDILFWKAQVAECMYFRENGIFEYWSTNEHLREAMSQCLCEAALWCPWVHMGDLKGVTECKFVALNALHFGHAIKMHPNTFSKVRRYALQFLDNLNNQAVEELTDVVEGFLVGDLSSSCTKEISKKLTFWQRLLRWLRYEWNEEYATTSSL